MCRAPSPAEAVTDAKGQFRMARLPAGEVLLTFTAPAGWKILAGENGESDHTLAQIIAEEGEGAQVYVAAQKVAVPSPSPSGSRWPSSRAVAASTCRPDRRGTLRPPRC